MATGMWTPVKMPIAGDNITILGYEDFDTDPNAYEGKSVLILGEFVVLLLDYVLWQVQCNLHWRE